MKIEKLFKRVEIFFKLDEEEQAIKGKKRKKLINSLEKKITSMKEKIKESDNKEKKIQLKRELEVLINLRKRI